MLHVCQSWSQESVQGCGHANLDAIIKARCLSVWACTACIRSFKLYVSSREDHTICITMRFLSGGFPGVYISHVVLRGLPRGQDRLMPALTAGRTMTRQRKLCRSNLYLNKQITHNDVSTNVRRQKTGTQNAGYDTWIPLLYSKRVRRVHT